VLPPAILAVAPTDLEVGVLELALANTTLANSASNSFKGIIHDKESRKLHRTKLASSANALLRRLPSVTIASISKKKKSVTFEPEHPTPTASTPGFVEQANCKGRK
jgi:flagellar basal body rod protein FlgC